VVRLAAWRGPAESERKPKQVEMKFLRFLLGVLATVLLASCGNGSSAPAPTGFKVTAIGDTQVTLSWDTQPGVEYWVVYRAGSSIELLHNGVTHPDFVYREKVTPPYVVKGLNNGVQYAFTVDAHIDGGPGGAGAPFQTATPTPSGTSWTSSTTTPLEPLLRAAAWGKPSGASDNLYMGVGINGTLLTGSDGSNWTSQTAPSGAASLSGAAVAFGRLVAVGAGGATFYSTDGLTFTSGTLPSGWVTRDLTDLAFSGSLLVAVGKGGAILTSGDGISWIARDSQTSQDLKAVAYLPVSSANTGGFWIAAGSAGTVLKSSDGASWSAIDAFPSISGTKPDINGLAVLKLTSTSTTSTTITTTISYLVAAVGSDGNTSVLGSDSATWTPSSAGSQTLNKVAAAGGQFLAVGNAGAIYTSQLISPDNPGSTVTWTSRTTAAFPDGTDKNLVGLFRDPNLNVYVAYSDGGSASQPVVIRTK
jgi:hypothetical protein